MSTPPPSAAAAGVPPGEQEVRHAPALTRVVRGDIEQTQQRLVLLLTHPDVADAAYGRARTGVLQGIVTAPL